MKVQRPHPGIIGYEILRRLERGEAPGHPLDPRKVRAVLGVREQKYLVPAGVDVFELGLIDRTGPYELLPIDEDDNPLWDAVVHLLVGEAQAERQRQLLLNVYRVLCEMIAETDELKASVAEWSRRRKAHPVFGMLRLAMIEVWVTRRGQGPLSEREFGMLHAEVARRVATRVGGHVVRP